MKYNVSRKIYTDSTALFFGDQINKSFMEYQRYLVLI